MILSTVLSKRFKNLLNRVATHTHTTHMCKEPLKHIIFFCWKNTVWCSLNHLENQIKIDRWSSGFQVKTFLYFLNILFWKYLFWKSHSPKKRVSKTWNKIPRAQYWISNVLFCAVRRKLILLFGAWLFRFSQPAQIQLFSEQQFRAMVPPLS